LGTYRDGLPISRQSPIQSSNRAQCRATTLIETNVLPLHHMATFNINATKCSYVMSWYFFITQTLQNKWHNTYKTTTGSMCCTTHFLYLWFARDTWYYINVFLVVLVVVVVQRRTRDVRSLVRLPAGVLSSQLGQLSLPSLRGR